MQYHPDIKRMLFFISSCVGISGISLFVGSQWNKVMVDYEEPEVLGKLKFSTNVTCRSGQERNVRKVYLGADYDQTYTCNLTSKPNVKFNLNFDCQEARLGKICSLELDSF